MRIVATPGIANARETSMATMRAYGWGDRSVAPHAAPSIGRSEENANMPWALTMPSGRTGESPMRPVPDTRPPDDVEERHDCAARRTATCWTAAMRRP